MKVKTITYAMLRKTSQYENDRAEVTVEIDPKDNLGDAVREAKKICDAMLRSKQQPPAPDLSFENFMARK